MSYPGDRCGGSLQVCRLRVTELDGAGVPNPGAGNQIVTDAIVTLTWAWVISEGTELEQKTGCDDVCLSFQSDDSFKRVSLELTICHTDWELVQLLSSGDLITSAGDTIGYAAPASGAAINPNGAFIEAWTKHLVSDTQDTAYPWHRWVFPKSKMRLGSHTLENGILTVSMAGFGTENTNAFDGPANDLPDTDLSERAMSVFLDTAVPAAQCGSVTLAAS